MALRSLNSTAADRKKKNGLAMKKTSRFAYSNNNMASAGAKAINDENADLHLLGSPCHRAYSVQPAAAPPPLQRTTASLPAIATAAPLPPAAMDSAICSMHKHQDAPPPPPTEDTSSEIEYILSDNLQDFADVDDSLSTLLESFDSKDWLKLCEAINNLRRLAIFHETLLLPLLDQAVGFLVKAMKNPRSALCKTAIMACSDLFRAYRDRMLPLLEPLLLQLLLKASQDKRFVCEEAEKSLEVMTSSLSPASVIVQMQPYLTHRNPRVRAKAAVCLCRCVSRLGSEGIKDYGFQPLLQTASSLLNDQLPEARESARKVVAEVYAAYPHNSEFRNGSAPQDAVEEDESSERPTRDALQDGVIEGGEEIDWLGFCNRQLPSHVAQSILRITSTM